MLKQASVHANITSICLLDPSVVGDNKTFLYFKDNKMQ